MSGMFAARVLADHFNEVVVIERDVYPRQAIARDGVPQARHLHVLLPCGHRALEEFFPGVTADWLANGADLLDAAQDLEWRTPAGYGLRFESDLRLLAASRPLIDFGVQKRLAALPNVKVREGAMVENLLFSEDGARARGVRWRAIDSGATEELEAALVVDASGRMSRTPEWLRQAGYEAPGETVVNAHLGYASRLYRRNPDAGRDWKALFLQSAPPKNPRAGLAFPIEGDRWLVTLCGGGKDYAPTEEAAYLEFARSLPDPRLYQLLTTSEPLTPITGYRRTENRRRHYEQIRRFPQGLLVFGDSACAFNPVYGQGISVAALCAQALRECMKDGDRSSLAIRFHRKQAAASTTPWALATSEDVRYPNAEGAKETLAAKALHWYVHHVMAASTHDTQVRYVLLRVFGMIDEPSVFFRPWVAWRVLREAFGRRSRAGDSGRARSAAASHA